jgi:hypothetical protein
MTLNENLPNKQVFKEITNKKVCKKYIGKSIKMNKNYLEKFQRKYNIKEKHRSDEIKKVYSNIKRIFKTISYKNNENFNYSITNFSSCSRVNPFGFKKLKKYEKKVFNKMKNFGFNEHENIHFLDNNQKSCYYELDNECSYYKSQGINNNLEDKNNHEINCLENILVSISISKNKNNIKFYCNDKNDYNECYLSDYLRQYDIIENDFFLFNENESFSIAEYDSSFVLVEKKL